MIKKYFDRYRELGKLPPELEGKLDGVELFPDPELLNKWRSWRTALAYQDPESGAVLSGMLDDLGLKRSERSFARSSSQGELDLGVQKLGKGELFDSVRYVPLDYKTRGFDAKEGGENFYKNQLNCYGLLLRENGMKPAGHAYLLYYIPKEVAEKGMTRFDVVPKRVEINPDEALKVLRDAVALMKGPMPTTHSECQYCAWGNDFIND